MEYPFSAYNVRNIRAAGLGLVPNESPKVKDYGPCLVFPIWLSFGLVSPLFQNGLQNVP